MTSTGRVAATTLNHRLQTLGLEITRPCRRPKGHSLPQNSTTTARMAPSWMTTRNMDMNSSLALNLTICSSRIIWPVDEMGSHSVMPSTMPIKIALMISQNVRNPSFLHTRERAAFLTFPVYHTMAHRARRMQKFYAAALCAAGCNWAGKCAILNPESYRMVFAPAAGILQTPSVFSFHHSTMR